jgi:hypothetical protein
MLLLADLLSVGSPSEEDLSLIIVTMAQALGTAHWTPSFSTVPDRVLGVSGGSPHAGSSHAR